MLFCLDSFVTKIGDIFVDTVSFCEKRTKLISFLKINYLALQYLFCSPKNVSIKM